MIIVLGVLGGAGYGAYAYYTSTQQIIGQLRENNARLEIALETATESLEAVTAQAEKAAKLNKQLQSDLQAAEAYSDELRSKFSRLNLVQEALRDSEILEGKMNGATAKLWREFMGDTGNDNQPELPQWLQQSDAGAGSESSNSSPKVSDTDSSKTESSTTN